MTTASSERRAITAAQRGQIIQLVIVNHWSAAQAAATYGIEERLVAVWVAAYRRDGMASLRQMPSRTALGQFVDDWIGRPLAQLWRLIGAGLARLDGSRPTATPEPLHRSRDDRRHGG